jgi:hypothetical protein
MMLSSAFLSVMPALLLLLAIATSIATSIMVSVRVFAGKRRQSLTSLTLLVTVLTFGLTLNPVSRCQAQNQALPPLSEGTELIVTDEASEVILGYGTVQGGRLELNLSATTATMVVLFISPNGSFTTLRGYLGEDRRLWLTDEAMQALTNLESLSQRANIALRVSGVAADAFVAGDDDDDRLRPPEQLAQPATRPADGTSSAGAASSRIGIGMADQDDDDDNNRNQTTVSRNPEDHTPEDQADISGGLDTPADGNSDMPSSPNAPATPAPSEPEIDVSEEVDDDAAGDDAGSPDDGENASGGTADGEDEGSETDDGHTDDGHTDDGDASDTDNGDASGDENADDEDADDDSEEETDEEEGETDEDSDDHNGSEGNDNASNEGGEGDD